MGLPPLSAFALLPFFQHSHTPQPQADKLVKVGLFSFSLYPGCGIDVISLVIMVVSIVFCR